MCVYIYMYIYIYSYIVIYKSPRGWAHLLRTGLPKAGRAAVGAEKISKINVDKILGIVDYTFDYTFDRYHDYTFDRDGLSVSTHGRDPRGAADERPCEQGAYYMYTYTYMFTDTCTFT